MAIVSRETALVAVVVGMGNRAVAAMDLLLDRVERQAAEVVAAGVVAAPAAVVLLEDAQRLDAVMTAAVVVMAETAVAADAVALALVLCSAPVVTAPLFLAAVNFALAITLRTVRMLQDVATEIIVTSVRRASRIPLARGNVNPFTVVPAIAKTVLAGIVSRVQRMALALTTARHVRLV